MDLLKMASGFGLTRVFRGLRRAYDNYTGVGDQLVPAGSFDVEIYDGVTGALKHKERIKNTVVNQGKNDMLNVYFADGTPTALSSWFMGLISSSGYTAISASDTAASHSGWTEFTGYSQSNRVAWGQTGPSTGVTTITNSSPATFDITSSGTLKGGFIITNNTKGGTSGKLWAAALFSADVPVNNGDQMKITYNLST